MPGEKPQDIGPVRFVVEERTVQRQASEAIRGSGKGPARKFRKVMKDVTVHGAIVVKVPFKKIRVWPFWLGAFGDTLSLVLCVAQLNDSWKESKVVAVGKLGMNTFQAIGSVGQAFYYTFRAGTEIPGLLKVGGGAGLLLEAVFNAKEGLFIILSGDDGAATRAFDRGDTVEGVVRYGKGVVLVASGAAGTGMIVVAGFAGVGTTAGAVGTAAEMALGPVSMILSIAALVVVGIEAGIYAHSGPDDAMKDIDDRLKDARDAEFGDPGKYRVSRTADDIGTFHFEMIFYLGKLQAR